MKLFLTRKLPREVCDAVPADVSLAMYEHEEQAIPREELLARVAGARGIVTMLTERIDEEVMDAAGPSLAVISTMSVGYEHIDRSAANTRGIVVCHTPDVLTETTADLVFALLLATARQVPQAERALRNGQWGTWQPFQFLGIDVYGKTIGLLGMGGIAQAVARRARGFGMRILYWSRTPKPDVEEALGVSYSDLTTLLQTSDFVVPLLPGGDATRHLIDQHALSHMKRSAMLINASRGSVVDEDALCAALHAKTIAGAGLDVLAQEPIAANHPLLREARAVLLPHIGSATLETRTRMARRALENAVLVMRGEAPFDRV
ncbi:2-hydroxyacid dehydrogenase [Ferroacidibacillus organovorans]|uniref:D-glycerate dehydrogenase n=1 Tax=Ferroacidibacillus organovorans TaxID=1765683 RepID=A0A853K8A6_9BACL|nr:D-glycerate dehydrogenase [Ferroacidibacillus organovorans]KYP81766.1 D-glycerate dehydrogenase [Ferroacidibacillus organovorans]OAG93302.1 D-glycerate dehydrogenase [Ferroacidibacillus organovorans]